MDESDPRGGSLDVAPGGPGDGDDDVDPPIGEPDPEDRDDDEDDDDDEDLTQATGSSASNLPGAVFDARVSARDAESTCARRRLPVSDDGIRTRRAGRSLHLAVGLCACFGVVEGIRLAMRLDARSRHFAWAISLQASSRSEYEHAF